MIKNLVLILLVISTSIYSQLNKKINLVRDSAYTYRNLALKLDSLNEKEKAILTLDTAQNYFFKLGFKDYPIQYALLQYEWSKKNGNPQPKYLEKTYNYLSKYKNTNSNYLNLTLELGWAFYLNNEINRSFKYFNEYLKLVEKNNLTVSKNNEKIYLITNEESYYKGEYNLYLENTDKLADKLIKQKKYLLALNIIQIAIHRCLILETSEYIHEFQNKIDLIESNYIKNNYGNFSYKELLNGLIDLNNADYKNLKKFSLITPNNDIETIKDTIGYCHFLYLISNAYIHSGKHEMANIQIINACKLLDKYFKVEHIAKLPYYDIMSEVNYQISDFGNAKDIINKGLIIADKFLTKNHIEKILLEYNLGKNEKAIGRTTESLTALKHADSLSHVYINNNYIINGYIENELGEAYINSSEFNNSEKYLKNALQDFKRKIQNENHEVYAQIFNDLGKVYQNTENTNKDDIHNYLKSIKIYHYILGDKHPLLANGYLSVSSLFLKNEEIDSALFYVQKSILANVNNFESMNYIDSIPLSNTISNYYILNSLELKAKLLTLKAYNNIDSLLYFNSALNTFSTLTVVIETLRNGYVSEESKEFLSNKTYYIFEDAISLCMRTYKATLNTYYKNLAFVFSEKSRAGILLSAIKLSNAKKISGVPNEILEQEDLLIKKIAIYESKLKQEYQKGIYADTSKLYFYKENLYNYKYQYSLLEHKIQNEFPKYYTLKFDNYTPDIKYFQQNLFNEKKKNNKYQLVEYFLGKNKIYIFYISKDNFEIIETNVNDTRKYCRGLINSILFNNDILFKKCANYLYNNTIKPIEKLLKYKHLVIIPDGELSTIPFEVLMDKQLKSKKNNYLIRKYSIKYNYSASLLLQQKNIKNIPFKNKYLGIAPVFVNHKSEYIGFKNEQLNTRDSLKIVYNKEISPLVESKNEVCNVYKKIKKQKYSGVLLYGYANKSLIENLMQNNYQYIHFASHGYYTPSPSLIVSSSNDSLISISSGDIYGLKCKSENIVLSACESGVGKLQQGEGIIGLSRSFFYSGTQSVLVSLWKIKDLPCSIFMKKYFKFLDKKFKCPTRKENALRKTKLKFIKSKKYNNPIYWSPFILNGF
ncbi:MAG: CHAT domain-containing protein [Cytophagales bacterium]